MIKKLITLLMALVLVICMGNIALAEEECTHDEAFTTTFNATCDEDGYTVTYCDACKQEFIDTIPSKGHKFTWKNTKGVEPKSEATCVSGSVYYYSCWNCEVYGKGLTDETFEANDKKSEHSYGAWETVVEPKCGVKGTKTLKCTVEGCKAHIDGEIDALTHNWGEFTVTKAATCTEEGVETRYCLNEGCSIGSNDRAIEKAAHTEPVEYTVKTPATCTVDGTWEKRCTVCNTKISTGEIPATGHTAPDDFNDVKTEATCTTEGKKVKRCLVCQYALETAPIEATGHQWDDGFVGKQATCTEQGVITYTCTVESCGAKQSEFLPMLEHSLVDVEAKAADCKNSGYTAHKACENCDYTEGKETIKKSSHNYEYKTTVEPKCDVDGEKILTCTGCGRTSGDAEVITKLGHKWDEGVVTVPATCTTAGELVKTCANCGWERPEDTEATGHKISDTWTVVTPAVCGVDGEEVKYCVNGCGLVLNRQVIPMLKHAWDEGVETTPATCYAEGVMTFTCANEGCPMGTHTKPIEKTEHDRTGEWVVKTPATCTELGKEFLYCAIPECGEYLTARNVAATGHNYVHQAYHEGMEPHCTEEGLERVVCTNDPTHVDDVVIAPLGHDLKITERVAPTCTTEGTGKIEECLREGCDYKKGGAKIAKLAHTDGEPAIVEAGCTTWGYEETRCTECNSLTGRRYTAKPTGHTEEIVEAIAPTCTEVGYTEAVKCASCGKILEAAGEVAALGHDWTDREIMREAACGVAGVVKYTCANDATHLVLTDTEIPALEHKFIENAKDAYKVTDATCIEAAVYVESCILCGIEGEKTFTYGDALGHTAGEWVTTVEPSCTEAGEKVKKCTVCDEVVETEAINALGHATETVTTEETCTEAGSVVVTCTVCGEVVKTEEIAAAGHLTIGQKWGIELAPTCTEVGKNVLRCDVCNEVVDVEDVKANGHTPIKDADKAPTCTEAGYIGATVCEVCEEVLDAGEAIDALGHTAGEWVTTVEPSCTKAGEKVKKCTVCGEVVATEAIDVLDHTKGEWVPVKAPTCTEAGLENRVCAVCGEVIDSHETEALGHTTEGMEWGIEVAPTCTEVGKNVLRCAVCNNVVEVKDVAATGHTYTVTETDASCTEEGEVVYTCACGDTYTEIVEALGHTLVAGEAKAVTCTADGWDAYEYCTECDYTTKVVEPLKGHYVPAGSVGMDADAHWLICGNCNEACTEPETHNFTNVWEASKTETWFGCGCGYVLIVKE